MGCSSAGVRALTKLSNSPPKHICEQRWHYRDRRLTRLRPILGSDNEHPDAFIPGTQCRRALFNCWTGKLQFNYSNTLALIGSFSRIIGRCMHLVSIKGYPNLHSFLLEKRTQSQSKLGGYTPTPGECMFMTSAASLFGRLPKCFPKNSSNTLLVIRLHPRWPPAGRICH